MRATLPTVSVIIPHHHGRLIDRCLFSVAQSQGVDIELFVITSDPTYLNEGVRCYFLEDGPAAKRNLGAAKSHADTLIFLDDDVEVSPYCLYELWKFLADTPVCGMAFAKIYKMEEGRRDEFDATGSWITPTGFLYDQAGNGVRDRGQFDQATRCLASKSATCAIRRTAFQLTGGFDRDYFILGEETDLAWRLWLRGWEVWYCPTAVSWHAFGCESLKPKADHYTVERTMRYGCRNYLSLLLTNVGVLRLWPMVGIQLSVWVGAAIGFLCRGDAGRFRAILLGLWDALRRGPQTLRKRQTIQAARTRCDRALWLQIACKPPFSYYLSRLWRYWTTQLHG